MNNIEQKQVNVNTVFIPASVLYVFRQEQNKRKQKKITHESDLYSETCSDTCTSFVSHSNNNKESSQKSNLLTFSQLQKLPSINNDSNEYHNYEDDEKPLFKVEAVSDNGNSSQILPIKKRKSIYTYDPYHVILDKGEKPLFNPEI